MNDELEARISRLVDSPLFPLTRDFQLKALTEPMASELPRDGEGDSNDDRAPPDEPKNSA